MKLLAGLAIFTFIYLLIGFVTGWAPEKLYFKLPKASNKSKHRRQVWLNQAGVPVTPMQFWGVSLGIGLSSFVVLYAVTGTTSVSIAPAIGLGMLPRMYFAKIRQRRVRERMEAWPDALRSLVSAMSSSQSLHNAMKSLSTGGPVPLRPTFLRYSQLSQTLDQRSALEAIKEDLADPMSDRIVEVLIVATEAGPAIVLDIMRDLAMAATKDVQLQDKLDTAQGEQKLNAKAVFVLPFILLILMVAQGGAFRDFYSGPAGFIVIAIGSGLLTIGMMVVQKLGKVPQEPRVFAEMVDA